MVEHDVFSLSSPDGIGSIVDVYRITTTETDESDDDIVCRNRNRVIGLRNAIARGGLSRNGNIAFRNFQVRFQIDDTTDIEYDGSFATLTQCFAQ